MKLSFKKVPKRRFRTLFLLQYSPSTHYNYRRCSHATGSDPSKTPWVLYTPNNIYWHFDGATLTEHENKDKLLISLHDRWTEVCFIQAFQIHFHFYMTAYVVVIY